MIYEWGHKSFGVDPNIVGSTIERLAKENGGACPPGHLVDEARPDESPLHGLFEWDDVVAADSWRRHEARRIISCLVVVDEALDANPPAFVHVKVHHDDGEVAEGYSATVDVIRNPALRGQVLAEAVSKLNGLRRRYNSLAELQSVWEALDSIEPDSDPVDSA